MKLKLTTRTVANLTPQEQPYEVYDPQLKGFMLRVQPSGVMSYYYIYRNKEGRQRRVRIARHGNVTPVQARDEAEKLSGQVIAGVDVQASKQDTRRRAEIAKERTLGSFIEKRYGPWVTTERKTGHAIVRRICVNFAHLMDYQLTEINTWVIEKWRSERIKAGKARATVNRDVVSLKACLSKAVEWDVIENHPLAKLKPLKVDKVGVVRYLTDEEESALRRVLDEREDRIRRERLSANEWRQVRGYSQYSDLKKKVYVDHLKPAVLLSVNTGLRRGELFSLRWKNVNFHTCTLTVSGSDAKSGHTRHVPLSDEAFEVLTSWEKQSDGGELVFPGKDAGSPMTTSKKSWAAVLKEAGISDFRWHDMRHHFASRLAMAGVDLNTIRELLGHADLTMTLRYAHLSPDHKADAVAKLNKQQW